MSPSSVRRWTFGKAWRSGGEKSPVSATTARIEVYALDSDFAANVEDRLTIPGGQRIGLCCGGST